MVLEEGGQVRNRFLSAVAMGIRSFTGKVYGFPPYHTVYVLVQDADIAFRTLGTVLYGAEIVGQETACPPPPEDIHVLTLL